MTHQPLIGLSLDWEESGSFSQRPHYALRQGYFDAVHAAGGLPIGLPLIQSDIPAILGRLDGLVIVGGSYPSPGWWYGEDYDSNHPRAVYDNALVKQALQADIPLLGICAGFQTLVANTGGILHKNVKDALQTSVIHRDIPHEQAAHTLTITPGSLLHRITGLTQFEVNSWHREGAAKLGEGTLSNATAPDGLVEALEIPGKRFALGAQWHPEFMNEPGTPNAKIWQAFIQAAIAYAPQKP